ncbi:MAG TPA: PIG-L family deacetylase [Dermatophilaceae bacterium]|nr:PIG-L family deacetylase [Dermatophilaceae bacterium]
MAAIVFLHAHPDDEASQTSGAMARAADEGHRVITVFATGGEHGQAPHDLGGQSVVEWRRAEAQAAADVLSVSRVVWLGYADSGMSGWPQNSDPNAFAGADLDEAAGRVAAVLDQEQAEVVVGYDWHGGYGHPDHVAVHRVAHRAAELAGRRPRLLEVTMNRDRLRAIRAAASAAVVEMDFDPDAPMDDGNSLGTPEADIHWEVDVTEYLPRRRAALECHASQVTDVGFFLSMPEEAFAQAFGREYYREPGCPPGMRPGWFLNP